MFEFEDLWYNEMKKAKFNSEKIWLQTVKKYNTHNEDYIKNLESEFRKISDNNEEKVYKEKIKFWIKNRLTPLKTQYTFSLIDENLKHFKAVISIEPYTNNELIKIYLKYLIEWCYNEYSNHKSEYNFETVPFKELKSRFYEIKDNKNKKIDNEIRITKDRIKNTGVSNDVYKFVIYKTKEPNMLSDLKITNNDFTISLQHFAIETAFVLDFLKYLIFLNTQKIESNNSVENYVPIYEKSFKTNLSDEKLQVILDKLIQCKIIVDISFEKFKSIFSETNLLQIREDDKIIWLPKKTKGVNWESLALLIKEICGYDDKGFDVSNISNIVNKIGFCFNSPNNIFNYSNGFPRTIRDLKKNNFKPKSKNSYFDTIEDIFSEIS